MKTGEKATLLLLGALTVAALVLGGCPPQPKPNPAPAPVLLRDAAPDSCSVSLDLGVPTVCFNPRTGALLFNAKSQPCLLCPVPRSCYWERVGVWCVPDCAAAEECHPAKADVQP